VNGEWGECVWARKKTTAAGEQTGETTVIAEVVRTGGEPTAVQTGEAATAEKAIAAGRL
jgi:hypothetical protein